MNTEVEMEMDFSFYSRHYILVDEENRITSGWSDGPHPERDTTDAICINGKGGYQFRLVPGGTENPSLYNMMGVSLYKYEDGNIIERTQEEIDAEMDAINKAAAATPAPVSEIDQLRADVDFLAAMQGVEL